MSAGGWPLRAVSDLGAVVTGSTPPTDEPRYWGGPIPFVTPSDLGSSPSIGAAARTLSAEGAARGKLLPPRSVLATCIASIGKNAITTAPCCTNQQINAVICNDLALPEFVYYALCARSAALRRLAGATSVTIVTREQFGRFLLPLPPLPQQRGLVSVLASVDDVIAATEAVLGQLGVVRQATRSALMPWPGGAAGLPDGWAAAPLGQLCRVVSGGTPDRGRPELWNGGIPWVKTGEIRFNEIRSTEETLSPAGVARSSAKIIPRGALLLAMYGQGTTRGRVAWLGVDAACNQACLAILPGGRLDARFLFHSLCARYDELRRLGHENSQKNLSARLVKEVPLAVPPPAEQERIVRTLDAIDARIDAEQGVLAGQRRLRSELLAALLSGERALAPRRRPSAAGRLPGGSG